MYYKRLHKMIERFTAKKFSSELAMLKSVLKDLVDEAETPITGGRVWQLRTKEKAYQLKYQYGQMGKIENHFLIHIVDYPIFDKFITHRAILANETNIVLRQKGIFQYAAAGVGSKNTIDNKRYFEYLIALNSNELNNEFRETLNIIATVLTSKLNELRTSRSHLQIKEDLDKALLIQKRIIPEHEFHFHDYDLYGVTIPAETLGGDFFDYLEIGEDKSKLGIALGDAASKGVAAAAEAMYISGAVRMAMAFEIKINTFMKKLNRLVHKIFGDDKFTSMFYGELSKDKHGLFLYANAGHNPPVFMSSDGRVTLLNPTGMVLGPAPDLGYHVDNINFSPGDLLVLYSDGVTESTDENDEQFGDNRLLETIKRHSSKPPKEIAIRIIDAVVRFTAKGTYNDDKTIVVIKKRPENV